MFGRKKVSHQRQFDNQLLLSIDQVKAEWDQAKQTEEAVADVDNEMSAQTALARQKYLFLYREARRRQVHGTRIQSAVYSD